MLLKLVMHLAQLLTLKSHGPGSVESIVSDLRIRIQHLKVLRKFVLNRNPFSSWSWSWDPARAEPAGTNQTEVPHGTFWTFFMVCSSFNDRLGVKNIKYFKI